MNGENTSGILIHMAEDMFKKSIQFKIYCITDKEVGTSEHTHNYMQIWYVSSGCCEHYVNNKAHRLVRGDIFVLPPFVTHRIEVIEGMDIKIIGCEFLSGFINENITAESMNSPLFDFAYLEPFLLSKDSVSPRLNLAGKGQIQVEQLLEDMLEEYEQEKKYYEITIKADLLKLLATVAREYENSSDFSSRELFNRYRDAVTQAINYTDEHFTENIHVKDVCKISMMSQPYFSYLFGQITGKTFVEYLNGLRIRKAVEMLETTDKPITDICFSTGYNDVTYFDRVFKKEMGLTPRKYRLLKKG